MTAEIDHQEIMWATMKPSVYGGDSCEEHEPCWDCYADGDMEGGPLDGNIELSAETFAPGTKVIVKSPVCPECDTIPEKSFAPEAVNLREPMEKDKTIMQHVWRCQCDFDWRKWAEDQFS